MTAGVVLASITEVSSQGLWNKGPVGNQGGGEECDGETGDLKVESQKVQFVSLLFTVPKKDGSCQPVVNLREDRTNSAI